MRAALCLPVREKGLTVSEEFKSAACWYALQTNPKQEDRAHGNLLAWGVESFSPRLREGRRNEFSGAVTYYGKPMFPRYIFARFDAEKMLSKIWYTRGVHSVVGFGGGPSPIPDEVIEVLRSQVGADGYVKLCDEFKPGEELVITSGPLKNFRGVFERRAKDRERVLLLLEAVNYQGRLSVESDAVRRCAQPSAQAHAAGAGGHI
jgi:transcriptional antiterminator RfaH